MSHPSRPWPKRNRITSHDFVGVVVAVTAGGRVGDRVGVLDGDGWVIPVAVADAVRRVDAGVILPFVRVAVNVLVAVAVAVAGRVLVGASVGVAIVAVAVAVAVGVGVGVAVGG